MDEYAVAFQEVYGILSLMGDEYINRIPDSIMDNINKRRKRTYEFRFDTRKEIYNQDISEKALNVLEYINLYYWCNEEEKKEILRVLNNNEIKLEKGKREKYDIDVFKNKENKAINKNTDIQIIEKQSFIKKILNKIKKWLKIN